MLAHNRWRPSSASYYSLVYGKRVVLFDAIKTRSTLAKCLKMIRFLADHMLPTLFLDPGLRNMNRFLFYVSRHRLGRRLLFIHRWPSGLLSNYFIVLPNITNLLSRIGPRRSIKRRVSVLFPIEVPFFAILGSYKMNTALSELNLYSVPLQPF